MLKKKTLVFFSRNCHVHISALFAHKQAYTFLCQLFAMQATRLSATFQFRPKQNKSFFNLFAFALPASLPPLSQNTIFTHTTVYPANVEWWLVLLCLTYGGGDGMGNRRRIRWAHTRSQETSLALWKWDTNERVNVLALACMCVPQYCASLSFSFSCTWDVNVDRAPTRNKRRSDTKSVWQARVSVCVCVYVRRVRIWRTCICMILSLPEYIYACTFVCVCDCVCARIIILTECAAFAVITNWHSYVAATFLLALIDQQRQRYLHIHRYIYPRSRLSNSHTHTSRVMFTHTQWL